MYTGTYWYQYIRFFNEIRIGVPKYVESSEGQKLHEKLGSLFGAKP